MGIVKSEQAKGLNLESRMIVIMMMIMKRRLDVVVELLIHIFLTLTGNASG
jgi:hypothetical protein